MVLDSQIRRAGGGRRRTMGGRQRRGRRWPLALLLVVCVLGVVWMMWPTSASEAGGGSSADGAEQTDRQADDRSDRQADASAASEQTADEAGGAVSRSPRQGGQGDGGQRDTNDRSAQRAAAAAEREAREAAERAATTLTIDRSSRSRDSGADRDALASDDTAATPPEPRRAPPAPAPSQRDDVSTTVDAADPVDRARSVARSASGDLQRGMDLIADREFIEGRRVLSRVLYSGQLSSRDAQTVRDTLTSINRELIFSSAVDPDDPIVTTYRVQPGDVLSNIARRYHVPYGFVMEINSISDARRIQVGQTLKLVKGPLHARVFKRDYIMDITVDGPDGEPIYIRTFAVGLGEHDSTPPGEWLVAPDSKVVNPNWRNPRTGEFFDSDDPDNPLGGYWLGLVGVDDDTRDLRGYGIHGTIEPETVGQQASMGCIRLRDGDIERVFHMLQEGHSRVTVRP